MPRLTRLLDKWRRSKRSANPRMLLSVGGLVIVIEIA